MKLTLLADNNIYVLSTVCIDKIKRKLKVDPILAN